MAQYNINEINFKRLIDKIVYSMKNWAEETKTQKVVVAISGGKDSSVVAALAVKAFGKENVIGVSIPNGIQEDIDDVTMLKEFLDIELISVNIDTAFNSIIGQIDKEAVTEQCGSNLPPRLRMAVTFAVAQQYGVKVLNTCNMSEEYIGWCTLFGDDCGAYAPIRDLTCTEVIKLGEALGLPKQLYNKAPSDGLCGKTDEEAFGFTYADLDNFIRTGMCNSWSVELDIRTKFNNSSFKRQLVRVPGPDSHMIDNIIFNRVY